jgi:uncharacterized protein with NRDE domain
MNLKTGPNYKMSKTVKMLLTNFKDPHERGSRRRGFIEADLFAAESAKTADKEGKKRARQDQSSD